MTLNDGDVWLSGAGRIFLEVPLIEKRVRLNGSNDCRVIDTNKTKPPNVERILSWLPPELV
jgi:hypothetical protein